MQAMIESLVRFFYETGTYGPSFGVTSYLIELNLLRAHHLIV